LEIALRAGLFLICGEFGDFGVAFYHSAVNYTTSGYGDIILTASWRLLGPLEAANGALLFGALSGGNATYRARRGFAQDRSAQEG
jgi:hypothetical protein